ncbi:MAG: Crp/Fnr family transcriptional regulator [Pseudarcicella sp.]|nr:Crp/Fnr family transcriptional regulator [Pseudarcicella sp.]
MESLINEITLHETFTNAELEIITSKFKRKKFIAKDFLLKESQIAKQLHFIEEGLVRVFYMKDGKEITTYLSCDKGFVSSYSSFINQTKSYEFIQCIENTETFTIEYSEMQELYDLIPKWQKIGRILSESTVVCLSDRLLKIHTIPAKEKYLDFLKTSPKKIITRTPLIHIASFLGITPESLSRIRKEIS